MRIRQRTLEAAITLCSVALLISGNASGQESTTDERQKWKLMYAASVAKSVDSFLKASAEEDRESAKRALMDYLYSPLLKEYREVLTPKLQDYKTSENSCLILGRLEPDENLRKLMLASKTTPLVVRARLGDIKAREEVIEHFKEADSPEVLRKRCRDLLYVGGEEVKETFCSALESADIMEGVQGRVAKSSVLVGCYLLVDQGDEEARDLQVEAAVNGIGGKSVGEKEHKKYVQKVETYLQKKMGRRVEIRAPYVPSQAPQRIPMSVPAQRPVGGSEAEKKAKDDAAADEGRGD